MPWYHMARYNSQLIGCRVHLTKHQWAIFDINWYKNSHYKDKTVPRPSYRYNSFNDSLCIEMGLNNLVFHIVTLIFFPTSQAVLLHQELDLSPEFFLILSFVYFSYPEPLEIPMIQVPCGHTIAFYIIHERSILKQYMITVLTYIKTGLSPCTAGQASLWSGEGVVSI